MFARRKDDAVWVPAMHLLLQMQGDSGHHGHSHADARVRKAVASGTAGVTYRYSVLGRYYINICDNGSLPNSLCSHILEPIRGQQNHERQYEGDAEYNTGTEP